MNSNHKIKSKASILLLSIMIFFFPSTLLAKTAENLAVFYELEGNVEKKYNDLVENKLKTIGFNLADPHHRVNDQYKSKYGSTTLDVLSFLPVVNDDVVMPLFNIDPRLAGFSPFNMLIHKTLDEGVTHVGHLTPEAILDIIGIEDKKVREVFIASFKPLDEMIEQELGGKKSFVPFIKSSADTMLSFEYEFERTDDIDDFVDDFQNRFEMSFIDREYLIAGFHNFLDTDNGEDMLEDYDIFWAYSLCHLGYSYNMFDNKGARPDAGLFAPCTMYMYVRKGTNKLVVGMPKLVNILDGLKIQDESRIALIEKLDREIPEILTAFGMYPVTNVNPLAQTPKKIGTKVATVATPAVKVAEKKEAEPQVEKPQITTDSKTINITIPTPPEVPKAIKVNTNNSEAEISSRTIQFSKRYPPNYVAPKDRKKKSLGDDGGVGEVKQGRISINLRGALLDIDTAKKRLTKAGFEVIAVTPLNKKGTLTSIVFTNAELKKIASKTNRGFVATLRLLLDDKNKQMSITNPLYLSKAFLQSDFDETVAKKLLSSITTEFTDLKGSLDKFKFQSLANYQFMEGMPYYKDMEVVARGSDLLRKIKNNKRVVFEQKLENGATLIGVKLSKRTRKFPNRIGTKNAGMLPYPLLIENGEAKILDPKYYISVMYPMLTMEEFMTIATIPGAIIKDCGKVFK